MSYPAIHANRRVECAIVNGPSQIWRCLAYETGFCMLCGCLDLNIGNWGPMLRGHSASRTQAEYFQTSGMSAMLFFADPHQAQTTQSATLGWLVLSRGSMPVIRGGFKGNAKGEPYFWGSPNLIHTHRGVPCFSHPGQNGGLPFGFPLEFKDKRVPPKKLHTNRDPLVPHPFENQTREPPEPGQQNVPPAPHGHTEPARWRFQLVRASCCVTFQRRAHVGMCQNRDLQNVGFPLDCFWDPSTI